MLLILIYIFVMNVSFYKLLFFVILHNGVMLYLSQENNKQIK
jgi:hypothetical protein